jgi:GT2 family glycosyltransferase/MoaA/NifB/PqqE/SkfB family radical SAM enzyme
MTNLSNQLFSERGFFSKLPYSAHFLLNDKCNAGCVFCGGNYANSSSGRVLTLEKFKLIAQNIHLENYRQAVLAGAGDPLISPDFVPIMRYLHTTYKNVGIAVTTNGIALTRELAKEMLDCNVTMLNISLNAATRGTYRRLMQVDAFDRICQQVRDFASMCWELGRGPQLQLSIPIMRCNVEELPILIRFAHEVGASAINVFYCRFYPREIRNDKNGGFLPNEESLFFHQDLSDRIVAESEQLAGQLGIRLLHEPFFSEGFVSKCCNWTRNELMIGFDGEVFPCGGGELHFKKKLERGEYNFGNALHQTIEEFWNNESYRALRISSGRDGCGSMPECLECANMTSHIEKRGHILEWSDFQANEPVAASASAIHPLISVIVPTHNRPEMLRDAIQSVLKQTFQDFEIIIVNDAGQDASSVAQSFYSSKVKYISHDTNKGLAAARNTGIRAASGKYIAYLDDDDIYYPEHLETLFTFLQESGEKVAYTDAFRAHQHLQNNRYVTYYKDIPYSHDFDNDRILYENFVPVLCFMHEKSCLDRCGMFDEAYTRLEDWELWLRMSRYFGMHHIRSLTCEFRYRPDGSSMVSGSMPKLLDMAGKLFEKHYGLCVARPKLQAKRLHHLFVLRHDIDTQFAEIISSSGVDTFDKLINSKVFGNLVASGASHEMIHSSFLHYMAKKQQDDFTSERFLNQAIAADPNNHSARMTLNSLLVSQGRLQEVNEHLQFLRDLNPEDTAINSLINSLSAISLKRTIGDCMNSHQKRIKLAIYTFDLPDQACSQIRFYGIRGEMPDQLDILWGTFYSSQINNFTSFSEIAKQADIIVLARFFPCRETADVIERLFALGKPVVYDIDDLLTALPGNNPFKKQADEATPFIVDVAKRAALVTVSNQELQQEMLAFNQNVTTLPNLLDQTLWGRVLHAKDSDRSIVIGYAGGFTHAEDLHIIEEALLSIAGKFGSRVTFRFFGCVSDRLRAIPKSEYLEASASYGMYAMKLSHAGFDIALAPLVDNRFNSCKSNIKWLEYSACGCAGIYSDIPPYNSCIEHGSTGLLVENNTEKWVAAIERLITDTELRHSIAGNSRREVMARYTLKSGAYRNLVAYRNLLDAGSATLRCSIIIPAYNRLVFTRQCLDALLADTHASGHEIIVVDNGSRDLTPAYLRGLEGQVKVITNEHNLGFAKACNQGAQAAVGKYLIFLNNDTIPQPGWLEALVRGVEVDGAGIVGAKLLYPDGTVQHAGVAVNKNWGPYHIFNGLPQDDPAVCKKRFLQIVTGACMLVTKKLFWAVGGFDEAYRNGFEDVDLCLKATSAGALALYTPESVLVHFESKSHGRHLFTKENGDLFIQKWGRTVRNDDADIYREENMKCILDPDGKIIIERLP